MNMSIRTIQRYAVLYSIAALCLTLFFYPTWGFVGGLLAGAVVGIGNFRLLAYAISSFFSGGGQSGKWGVLFALKLIPLIAVAGLLILVVHVNPAAFVIGFLSIVFGIVYEGLTTVVSQERKAKS